MKIKYRIILAVGIVLLAAFIFIGCHDSSKESIEENTEQQNIPVVVIPEPCKVGTITIKDSDDNTICSYGGTINIINNGRNGELINISMTVGDDINE
jgi:hypothetical protein